MQGTSFATVLDHHFKMNQDYLLDFVQDLLQAEQELSHTLSSPQSAPDSKLPTKIRRKLVEWMIQLCDELRLGYKTKQAAVILADVALSKLKIHKNFLQLLGITCIFISIKCEESFTYTLDHACDHCANTYTKEEIGAMEMLIYKTLKWKLNYPTPGDIARRLVHLSGATNMASMPKFYKKVDNFIDLSLSEYDLSVYSPSTVAAASIMCAFGNSQAFVEKWRDMMINNGVFQLDFNAIDALYKNTIQMLIKYRPEYFKAMFSTPCEQEFRLEQQQQQSTQPSSPQDDFQGTNSAYGDSQNMTECPQEMSVMSFGSQETYYEPNNGEVLLESLSHVGTPTKNSPAKGYKNSLLDTEKLIRSNAQMVSCGQEGWNYSSTAMDEERSF